MLDMVAYTYNPSTQKAKANYEFEARLGYLEKDRELSEDREGTIPLLEAFNLSNLKKQGIEWWFYRIDV